MASKVAHPAPAHKPAPTAPAPKSLGSGSKYSKTEVVELKALFDEHDKNKDGRVSPHELHAALQQHKNLRKANIGAFRVLDMDKDGIITFVEYLRRLYPLATDKERKIMIGWVTPKSPLPQPPPFELSKQQLEEVKIMFNQFDANHDGKLTKEEVFVSARNCGYADDELEALFLNTDMDHDGFISFEEFVELAKCSFIA